MTMAIELTGDQKDAIDAVFQDISSDVTRGNGCFDRVDDMNDLVQGMLNDVRNATLEEVVQEMRNDTETDYCDWIEYSAYWRCRISQMKEVE